VTAICKKVTAESIIPISFTNKTLLLQLDRKRIICGEFREFYTFLQTVITHRSMIISHFA